MKYGKTDYLRLPHFYFGGRSKMGRTKFNVDKEANARTYDGIVFDSQLEMRYYSEVVLPGVKNGQINRFELQKKYELLPSFTYRGKPVLPITYAADFYIEYSDGHIEVIDTKGMPDSVAKIKRKLFWFHYPDIEYRWLAYSKKWGGWLDYDTIQKLRRAEKRSKNKKGEKCDGEK